MLFNVYDSEVDIIGYVDYYITFTFAQKVNRHWIN